MAQKTSARTSHSGPDHWDAVYEKPLTDIPWENPQPPRELVALLESGRFKAGMTALDVACGSGNYSVFLARTGFDVTGVDFSANALSIARKRAQKEGVLVDFVQADVRHLLDALPRKRFDLILDWSLLHHIPPADFAAYCKQFSALLVPDGVLLLACFSDADSPKAGQKIAVGKLGNVMHYRTQKEIEAAHRPLKVLQYSACRLGKKGKHAGHCFVLSKRIRLPLPSQ